MKQKGRIALIAGAVLLAVALFLVLSPHDAFRLDPAGRGAGTTGAEMVQETVDRPLSTIAATDDGPHVQRFGPPDEWFVAGAMGETYNQALTGEGLRIGEADVYLGQSPPDGPYLPWYVIGRAYPGWDTSALPDDAEVLSATLVLELPSGGGREETLDVAVYRGRWIPPLDLDDWLSPVDEVVARWQLPASRIEERESLSHGEGITLYAPEPARTIRAPLAPDVVNLTGATRLELRHAGEGTLPTTASVVLLGRSMISLEVEYRP